MKSFSELTSASQVNNGDLLAISQTSGSGYASKKTTVKEITDKSNLNLAEEYDSTSTYAVDDYVIYESVLYKCIASTTGTFDSTKWTSVVVTDEMGSGGGGGTGGHTIIDENGTSMTARAGLQFVGANVDDDATNNKTIVDLASAGGIDGVFPDFNNVIVAQTNVPSSDIASWSYTATEDCVIYISIQNAAGQSAQVRIDGKNVVQASGSYAYRATAFTALKKGQVVTVTGNVNTGTNTQYAVYGIQTGTTHSKFQPVIYSLEEREVGVWENGKPLYQKTFVFTPTGTNTNIDISSLNIDELVWRNATCRRDSGAIQEKDVQYRTESSGDNNYGIICEIRGTNLYTSIEGYPYSQIVKVRITLQYTKTTDTAGSGTWTPQGVPTHHYSTDEQVIGTWIDGKTLYEKTFVFPNNVSVTNWTTIMTLSGIDTLVDAESAQDDKSISYIEYWITDGNTLKGNSLRQNQATDYVKYLTLRYTKTS